MIPSPSSWIQVLVRKFIIKCYIRFKTCHDLALPNSLELSKVYPHSQLPEANAQTIIAEPPFGFIIVSGADLDPRDGDEPRAAGAVNSGG